MDISQSHTPIRHLGYHKTSKSQASICSSSSTSDIRRPSVVENTTNKPRKNFDEALSTLLNYLKRKDEEEDPNENSIDNDNSLTTYEILKKENISLKAINQNLKEKLRNLENNSSSIPSEENGVGDFEIFLIKENNDLRYKNQKLKKKYKDLLTKTTNNISLMKIMSRREEVESLISNTMKTMGKFMNVFSGRNLENEFNQLNANNDRDIDLSSESGEEYDDNNTGGIGENFRNFSENCNLNCTDNDNEKESVISTQGGANQIEIILKPFEKRKEVQSNKVNFGLRPEKNHNLPRQQIHPKTPSTNYNVKKSGGSKASRRVVQKGMKYSARFPYK